MLNFSPIRALLTLLLIMTFFLQMSCSTVKKDGPPEYNVDVSQIPDAKPKIEPLSRFGNKPSYQVFGKKYYVMSSSKNYQEKGTASWYGTKFHKRNTSNGEPYDMLAMTAAHKSLPLPTYVEVTNLGNGKKVIVKVNDRGPFVSNRIIDLSYAAAKKLGMTGRGTADVLVRALDPKTFQTNAPSQHIFIAHNTKKSLPQQHSPIYLQVGAFQNKAHAEKLKIQLAGITSFPVNITEFVSTKKLYRVQIGPLHDTNTVAEINKKLKSIGFTSRTILV